MVYILVCVYMYTYIYIYIYIYIYVFHLCIYLLVYSFFCRHIDPSAGCLGLPVPQKPYGVIQEICKETNIAAIAAILVIYVSLLYILRL